MRNDHDDHNPSRQLCARKDKIFATIIFEGRLHSQVQSIVRHVLVLALERCSEGVSTKGRVREAGRKAPMQLGELV